MISGYTSTTKSTIKNHFCNEILPKNSQKNAKISKKNRLYELFFNSLYIYSKKNFKLKLFTYYVESIESIVYVVLFLLLQQTLYIYNYNFLFFIIYIKGGIFLGVVYG